MELHKQYDIRSTSDQNKEKDLRVETGNTLRTDKDFLVKNLFSVTDVEKTTKHGMRIGLSIANSAYSVLLSEFFVGVRSVSVAPTITLPLAQVAGLGKIYIIKDLSGSASATTITIARSGTDTIDGDTSTAINTNYGFKGLFSDGANWFTS